VLFEQEQQRVAVVDPETRISFLFARCCQRNHAAARPVRALLYPAPLAGAYFLITY